MNSALLFVFLLASPLSFLTQAAPPVDPNDEVFGQAVVFPENLNREKRGGGDGRDPDDEGSNVREKRFAPAIPVALWGLRAAPALYRALVAAFSAAAVTQAGIEIASSRSESRRVSCCRGHYRSFNHIHNCLQRGGGCCADDKTYLPGIGHAGIVNPKKVSKRDTSGHCGECYSSYGKCTIR